MRIPLRRSFTLLTLTAAAVATGSIAVADGTSARDVAELALVSTPAPTPLPTPSTEPVRTTEADAIAAAVDGIVPAARVAAVPARAELLAEEPGWHGIASWYGPGFHGRTTANGERFDQGAMTAAHKTLPFNTRVQVTNLANGRTIVVRINDRGPFIPGREIDLSKAAARELGFDGTANVLLRILD